jgi:hypothetical protein
MNQKCCVVRPRLPDQPMSDPVPEVDAKRLGQRGTDRLPNNY